MNENKTNTVVKKVVIVAVIIILGLLAFREWNLEDKRSETKKTIPMLDWKPLWTGYGPVDYQVRIPYGIRFTIQSDDQPGNPKGFAEYRDEHDRDHYLKAEMFGPEWRGKLYPMGDIPAENQFADIRQKYLLVRVVIPTPGQQVTVFVPR